MTVRRGSARLDSLHRRATALASFAGVMAAAVNASAEPVTMPLSNEARADLLFHSGAKKFDGGDYAGACVDFSESLKLGPKLGTLLNLALCHETTGKLVTAWSEFTHGAAWAAQNNQRDRLDFATQHIRSLEPRLPRIVLQLPASRPISSIDLDGEPVPEQRWFLPLYLDAGEHRLAIAAPGKKRVSVAFRVTASPTDQLVMVPAPNEDLELHSGAAVADPGPRRPLAYAGLGVGAVGFALGTTFGILASGADTADAAREDAVISTVAFVGGALFATVGGWLLWSSGSANKGGRALAFSPLLSF